MGRQRIEYKWVVLLIISAAYMLAQGTRAIYAAVLPQIKADFASSGISDTKLGLVGSAFTLAFGLCIPFAGIFADLLKRKWVLAAGGALFSVGIFFSGFASGIGLLFISYGIINGIGQALMPPCNTSLISQFHTDTRGTAFSIYQAAIYAGIIICSIGSGWLAGLGNDGWRKAFWIFGIAGLICTAFIIFILKDTPQPASSEAGTRPSIKEALRAFVSKPTALILMAALGFYFFATYGFKNWAPMFIMRVFPDIPSAKAVFHAVFWFYLGAFAGVTISGRISDKLKEKRPAIRIEVELAGILFCVPFIVLMAYASNLPLMIFSITMFGFASGVYDSNLYAALLDVINPRYRAAATGIFGCGGCIVGALGPAVTGILSDIFSIRVAFASLAAFALAGAALVFIAKKNTFNKDII